jgi:hypothetical protein
LGRVSPEQIVLERFKIEDLKQLIDNGHAGFRQVVLRSFRMLVCGR